MTTCAKCGATEDDQTLVYAGGGPLVCYRDGECALRVSLRDVTEEARKSLVALHDLRAAVLAVVTVMGEQSNDVLSLVWAASLRRAVGERP